MLFSRSYNTSNPPQYRRLSARVAKPCGSKFLFGLPCIHPKLAIVCIAFLAQSEISSASSKMKYTCVIATSGAKMLNGRYNIAAICSRVISTCRANVPSLKPKTIIHMPTNYSFWINENKRIFPSLFECPTLGEFL